MVKPEIFDIFLIIGQSNSSGAADTDTDEDTARENSIVPPEGSSFCLDVNSLGEFEEFYDLSRGRKGYSTMVAKRWYEETGRGTLIVQTAVAGSPIERWEKGGEKNPKTGANLYDNTIKAAKYILSLGEGENPKFNIGDMYYIWCQGETCQAHEWINGHWRMPGINLIDADTYLDKFLTMQEGLMEELPLKFGAIMLVRTLARKSTAESLKLGLLTDMNPSKIAQYYIHANVPGVKIMSRVCDIARMETTPGPGAGFMREDNCHYKKKGYNAQGREIIANMLKELSPDTDKDPKSMEWIGNDGRTRLENGGELKVDAVRGAMTSAIVLPLWAEKTGIRYTVESADGKCTVDKFGTVRFAKGTAIGDTAVVTAHASNGMSMTVTAVCAEPAPMDEPGKGVVTDFIWTFKNGNLLEYNEYNNLRPGENTTVTPQGEGAVIGGPLVPAKKLHIGDGYNWSLRWTGKFEGQTVIAAPNLGRLDTNCPYEDRRCVLFCSAEGDVYEFPYDAEDGDDLILSYKKDTGIISLTTGAGKLLSSIKPENRFSSKFMTLLGKSKSEIKELKFTAFIEE